MNWGNRILITYLAFAALMIGLVTIAMQQKDIFLVDKEYYKEELAYQTKIDQISNANGLSTPVEYEYEGNQLEVRFPKDALPDQGTALLFRPSNANLDKKIPLHLSTTGVNTLPLGGLAKGLWRLKLSWAHAGKNYYTEHDLNLP
jgi:hypothetical protein